LSKNDVEELYEMLNDLTDKSKRFFHPHLFDRNTLTKIWKSKEDHYFVMVLDNVIIGYSFLRLFGYKIPSFGCCIRRRYEGKGYATMLSRWTINKAREIGYKKIILKVYKENERAFRMYQKTGFKAIGETEDTGEINMELLL
jgi:RimJ/RimL family protein N-acetyltransferase